MKTLIAILLASATSAFSQAIIRNALTTNAPVTMTNVVLSIATNSASKAVTTNIVNALAGGTGVTNTVIQVVNNGSFTNVTIYGLGIVSNSITIVRGQQALPQPSINVAHQNAIAGDLVRVFGGYHPGVTNMAKDGVNWEFRGAVVQAPAGDINLPNQAALFQDNPYSAFNQYGDTTNSMSFHVLGDLVATNLPSAFAAISGVKSKVSFEVDTVTLSPTASFVGVLDGVAVIQLPDLYNYPANMTNMDTRVDFKARTVSGLIYLSDCSSTFDAGLYTNVVFWLDRDVTNRLFKPHIISGLEARDCNILAGGTIATGHADGQVAVFNIASFYAKNALPGGNVDNDYIAQCNMGTIVFRAMTFFQNTNSVAKLFGLSTGANAAAVDNWHAGHYIFENCRVVGKPGYTGPLILADNLGSHTNYPNYSVFGQLAYINATNSITATNYGPGEVVYTPALTNLYPWPASVNGVLANVRPSAIFPGEAMFNGAVTATRLVVTNITQVDANGGANVTTNTKAVLGDGALWLPPAHWGGTLNTYGGAINWANQAQAFPFANQSGDTPAAKVQFYPRWGGSLANSAGELIITAPNIRLEGGFGITGANNRLITLGNEHASGGIFINYTTPDVNFSVSKPNGFSHLLFFNARVWDYTNGFLSWAMPAIQARGAPLTGGITVPGEGTWGELWFFTSRPFIDAAGDIPDVGSSVNGGLPVFVMRTNGVEVWGTNRLWSDYYGSRSNKFIQMPTNSGTAGQVITASAAVGNQTLTKWADASGGSTANLVATNDTRALTLTNQASAFYGGVFGLWDGANSGYLTIVPGDNEFDFYNSASGLADILAGSYNGNGAFLTTLNASALASGTVPTAREGSGTANNTTFLRGDQTWAVPAGGGGGTVSNLNTLTYGLAIVGGGSGGAISTNRIVGPLTVSGDSNRTNALAITPSGTVVSNALGSVTVISGNLYRTNTTTQTGVRDVGGVTTWESNGVAKVTIDGTTGGITNKGPIQTGGNFIPDTDNIYSLGVPGRNWSFVQTTGLKVASYLWFTTTGGYIYYPNDTTGMRFRNAVTDVYDGGYDTNKLWTLNNIVSGKTITATNGVLLGTNANQMAATAGLGKLISSNAALFYITTTATNLLSSGDGTTTAQTPWLSDINGASFMLTNTLGVASLRSNLLAPTILVDPNTSVFPASTVKWTNPLPVSITVYMNGSGSTITAINKNGSLIFSSGSATINLQPREYFSVTWTISTPSGTWHPFP